MPNGRSPQDLEVFPQLIHNMLISWKEFAGGAVNTPKDPEGGGTPQSLILDASTTGSPRNNNRTPLLLRLHLLPGVASANSTNSAPQEVVDRRDT